MPSTQSGKVLVSGANGFVATWVVQTFLDAGFSVRGTVRSAAKGRHLKRFFAPYGDKFELVVVPDITATGAFDEAVQGVDAIAHTASPFHLCADDPAAFSAPAVQGTIGILESARKYGRGVRRVVITSSAVAVSDMTVKEDSGALDEFHWNTAAVQAVSEKSADTGNLDKYCNSKVLAERGAWEFLDRYRTEVGWDIAVLNPPLVLGPVIHEGPSPAGLNTSTKMMFNAFFTTEGLKTSGGQWANVKDVGRAHLLAVMTELPDYVPLAAGFAWQDLLDAVPASATHYQKGFPGSITTEMWPRHMDNTRAQEVLGMEYTSMHETVEETLADYESRGWIKACN
ncbi:D-lactaldehyde dehydrogenase [Roridomyces roridus]|uniref:D-lactaldehyde dehydrogenase n=1 Tax=Roridomyces roridus TaxID=1738132 RepID=A0AAD7B6U0_9AGAR|nr:D-lactaldehyde dehydrogenase [Roridomyces roridus]